MGLLNVWSAVTPAAAGRAALLEQFSPLSVTWGSRLTAVFGALALLGLAFTLAYSVTDFNLLGRYDPVDFSRGAALRQTMVLFTLFYDPKLEPISGPGRNLANSIYLVGGLTLIYGLVLLLRPAIQRHPATAVEREQARQIVEKYGRSTLARFALFPDKAYWFSPGGSVVAYATSAKTAVALGDPIGPIEDAPAAITGFRDFCHQQGWQPAFYQTLPDYVSLYQSAGFEVVQIGQEAIVDLRTFTLEGKVGKAFCTPMKELKRLGYYTTVVAPPLSRELLRELRDVSDGWLALMHRKERYFSLGRFDDDFIGGSIVVVVRDGSGRIIAFANLIPAYACNQVSVDLMRHRRVMENGTMEFLFAALLLWCQEQNYDTLNLGLSLLSGVEEAAGAPNAEKAMEYAFDHGQQIYNFQSLHAYKEKLNPTRSPRFIIFPGFASLPTVWLALARVTGGDNFWRGYLRNVASALRRRITGRETAVSKSNDDNRAE